MIGAAKSAAAICACISLLAFSPLPSAAEAQTPKVQQSGMLPGGGVYVLRRDTTARTAALELWFRAPSAGYDSATPGISRLALTAIAASRPPHGSSLSEYVARIGGTLSLNVYPDIVMVGISVPAWQAQNALKSLTAAYFAPSISDDGFRSAVRDCAVAGAEAQFDPDRLLQDALFAHLFTSGPARYAPTPPASDYNKISPADVKVFAVRAFRKQNSVLTLAGSVDSNLLASVHEAGSAGNMDSPYDSSLSNRPADVTQDAQVGGLGFAWAGPPISDPKAATALDFIADYLFDPDHGTVSSAVRKSGSDAFVNGQFITLHDPGVLLVTISGSKAAAVRPQVLAAIAALQQPMDSKTFEGARSAFEYHIMSQIQTPVSRADNFGWYAAEGNLSYAPGNDSGDYLRTAQSLDPAYVSQIVHRYLHDPSIVQLTAGQHSQGTST
jgi:predicted Zn-dependent peptidase